MSHFVFSHVLQEIWRYIHLRNTNNVMYNCPSHPRNTHLKKITSHSPHHNVQVDIYIKIPGPCRRIPRQPTEETSARMTFRNIFPFKNERGPLWLDLLCKSKTILHKSKLKFTWTFRKRERERKEKIVDHMSFLTVTTHWRIYLFFFTFEVFLSDISIYLRCRILMSIN